MSFQHDAAFAAEVKTYFGDYVGTFESEHRQIRADVFKSGGSLVAHVSFPTGLSAARVTDNYMGELRTIATKQGLAEKLKIVYS